MAGAKKFGHQLGLALAGRVCDVALRPTDAEEAAARRRAIGKSAGKGSCWAVPTHVVERFAFVW